MYRVFLISFLLLSLIGMDIHGRLCFVYSAYPKVYGHGNRAKKSTQHYKTHWTLWQRLIWAPVFKERYDVSFELIAILFYIHTVFFIVATVVFLVGDLVYQSVDFYRLVVVWYSIYTILKFLYQALVSRSADKKPYNKRRRR